MAERLTESMQYTLSRIAKHDPRDRKGFHPSPHDGNTCKALERRGLVRDVGNWLSEYVLTDAGQAYIASGKNRW